MTTRTPLSSSLTSYSVGQMPFGSGSVATRAPLAVAAAATVASAATTVAAAATVAAAPAAAVVTGADRSQLLRRLAGDRRVVGEPQADPAALAVDLDHGDVDLVARR